MLDEPSNELKAFAFQCCYCSDCELAGVSGIAYSSIVNETKQHSVALFAYARRIVRSAYKMKAAINDVVPLKVARRDAIASLKPSWSLRTSTTVLTRFPSCHNTELSCSQEISTFQSQFWGSIIKILQHFLNPTIWQSLVDLRRMKVAKTCAKL